MSHPFSVTRRVEFCETDAAGIAHFSAFLCYMEQAEHALLRHLGTSVSTDIGDGWHLSWPRVHVSCDYRGSVRFEDYLNIQVRVERLGSRSVTYGFDFTLAPALGNSAAGNSAAGNSAAGNSAAGNSAASTLGVSGPQEAAPASVGQPLAVGKMVAVCCKVRTGSPLQSLEIPAQLRAKLEQYT